MEFRLGKKISEKDVATYIGLQNNREYRNEGVECGEAREF